MNIIRSTRQDLREMLDRLNDLLIRRDRSIAEQFAEDALFAGSDASDFARGRAAIATHFDALFAKPFELHFEWSLVEGEADWLFADGEAVIVERERVTRVHYQLSASFRREGDAWLWTLFHGSEPRS
jgi:ketosteroid isomerase-like protein